MNEICAHALQMLPEECCGLITGNGTERFRSVHKCRNEMTLKHLENPVLYPRDGKKAFHMSESDYMQALKDAASRGEQPSVLYHSHVEAGAYFSEMDLEFAAHDLFPFPDVAHIVIALADGKVTDKGIFERAKASGVFKGSRLEVVQK